MFRIFGGDRHLFTQWDTDQKLIVDGDYEVVHMSNGSDGAQVLGVYEFEGQRVVDVPNIYLQKDKPFTVYAFVMDDISGTYTEFIQSFQVVPKPKPDDYAYTETEVLTFSSLLSKAKESGEFDGDTPYIGENLHWWIGDKDTGVVARGISATHEWNGTVLKITSASGTTEDDLKGAKGDPFTYEDFTEEQLERLRGPEGKPGGVNSVNGVSPDENGNVEVTGGVDVTAQPGQLILVKSVDEKRKPAEWEAVDRTHWVERVLVEILPERQLTSDGSKFPITEPVSLTIGEKYTVNWNGMEYSATAYDSAELGEEPGLVYLINDGADLSALEGLVFFIVAMADGSAVEEGVYAGVFVGEGITELTLSIYRTGNETVHKLDNKYLDLKWLPTEVDVDIIPEYTGNAIQDSGICGMAIPNSAGILSGIENGTNVRVYINGVCYPATKVSSQDGYYIAAYGSESPDELIADKFLFFAITDYFDTVFLAPMPGVYTVRVVAEEKVPNPLPEEYLPATVPVVQTAEVGQAVVVKAVDEKRKPTEWETVDMNSSQNVDLSGYAKKTDIPDVSGFAKTGDIPSTLPNPNALTLTGAVEAIYDGSKAVSVEIPSGGAGGSAEAWEELINVTLEEEVIHIIEVLDNPGKFKRFAATLNLVGVPTNAGELDSLYITLNNAGQWTANTANNLVYMSGFSTSDVKYFCEAELNPMFAYVTSNKMKSGFSTWREKFTSETEITLIHVGTQNWTNKFGIGSVIKVYGVRV